MLTKLVWWDRVGLPLLGGGMSRDCSCGCGSVMDSINS